MSDAGGLHGRRRFSEILLALGAFILLGLMFATLAPDLSGDRNLTGIEAGSAGPEVDGGDLKSSGFDYGSYQKIQPGMAYSEVARLLGGPGTEQQVTTFRGMKLRKVVWQNAAGGTVIIGFADEKVAVRYATGF